MLIEETARRWSPPEDEPELSRPLLRPQTNDELREALWHYLGLRFSETPCCPGHSAPFLALADAFFARAPVVVWKASRGFGGKTLLMAALAFMEALLLRASVTLLGGSGEQAARVHEYLREFWRLPSAPHDVLASDPSGKRTTLIWGNKVTALMASMASVSGPHPQRLRLDEVDLIDIPLMDQAFGQPMSKDGVAANIVLSSAHYEADGTLTEVLKRADEHQGPDAETRWLVHQWCFRENLTTNGGFLDPSEVKRVRATVTKAMFDVQYDLQEPNPEGRAIDPVAVEWMFMGAEVPSPVGGGEFPYREFEAPVQGAHYTTGADWARTSDYVEMATFRDDVTPMRLVAYQRFRKKPAPYILATWKTQAGRYPGSACHDATSLGGQLMADLIEVPDETEVVDFVMTGGARRNLFTDWVLCVERHQAASPRVTVLHRQHKFVKNDDLWGAGHPPDGFVACAMAWHGSLSMQGQVGLVGGTSALPASGESSARTGLQAMLRRMSQEEQGLHPCRNHQCERGAPASVAYCCHGCALADEGRYEIHEDGPLGHSDACDARHATAAGLR